MLRSVTLMLLLLACAVPAGAVVIGHADVDGVSSLPLSVMDAVGEQRWLFTHASVGANMLDGMQVLGTEDPARYQFGFQVAGDWSQVYPPPSPTVPGTIYDGARGNPGWAAKFAMFDAAVRDLGWRYPVIDAAMDKLCYIDPDADVSVYLSMMTALEADFPQTKIVYMTMPLQSGSNMNWSNMLAMAYNQAVRAHCATPDRLLLDIADIESHDPAGNPITFTYEGQVYQRLYSGYTSDGGHLNALGARRVALGWYGAAAALAGAAGTISDDWSLTPPDLTIAPNPAAGSASLRFRIDRTGVAGLSLYDIRGRVIRHLAAGSFDPGIHSAIWDGRDDAGRAVPSGVYLARIRTGSTVSVRRVAWVG